MNLVDKINKTIETVKYSKGFNVEKISDGFHTFKELYEFRKLYNAALFNEWAKQKINFYNFERDEEGNVLSESVGSAVKYDVHKSWKHSDGKWCFGKEKEYFIVVAETLYGQITNHYKAEDWDLFKIPEKERANTYDGHSSQEVLRRLFKNIKYGNF